MEFIRARKIICPAPMATERSKRIWDRGWSTSLVKKQKNKQTNKQNKEFYDNVQCSFHVVADEAI